MGLLLAWLRQAMEAGADGDLGVAVRQAVLPLSRLLALCCRDEESAVAVGLLGGHLLIKRLMGLAENFPYQDDEEDEVAAAAEEAAECAAEVASRCSVVRGGFPLRCELSCGWSVSWAGGWHLRTHPILEPTPPPATRQDDRPLRDVDARGAAATAAHGFLHHCR